MADKRQACEAVLIRYRPNAAAGEQLNIGALVWAPDSGIFEGRFLADWKRIADAFLGTPVDRLQSFAESILRAAKNWKGGHLGELLKVISDSELGIQTSEIMAGETSDPKATLEALYSMYVGRAEVKRIACTHLEQDFAWESYELRKAPDTDSSAPSILGSIPA